MSVQRHHAPAGKEHLAASRQFHTGRRRGEPSTQLVGRTERATHGEHVLDRLPGNRLDVFAGRTRIGAAQHHHSRSAGAGGGRCRGAGRLVLHEYQQLVQRRGRCDAGDHRTDGRVDQWCHGGLRGDGRDPRARAVADGHDGARLQPGQFGQGARVEVANRPARNRRHRGYGRARREQQRYAELFRRFAGPLDFGFGILGDEYDRRGALENGPARGGRQGCRIGAVHYRGAAFRQPGPGLELIDRRRFDRRLWTWRTPSDQQGTEQQRQACAQPWQGIPRGSDQQRRWFPVRAATLTAGGPPAPPQGATARRDALPQLSGPGAPGRPRTARAGGTSAPSRSRSGAARR